MSGVSSDVVRSWTLILSEHRGMEEGAATMLDECLARALLRDIANVIEERGGTALIPVTTYKRIARQIRMESYVGDPADPPPQEET